MSLDTRFIVETEDPSTGQPIVLSADTLDELGDALAELDGLDNVERAVIGTDPVR